MLLTAAIFCGLFQEPTLYIVKGMVIMDNDGNRILAKYFDNNIFPTVKEQKAFEKNLFGKTHRANSEVIMLDGLTCVYKSNVDLFFYVMGSCNDNEVTIDRFSFSGIGSTSFSVFVLLMWKRLFPMSS